jgi:hypothetical protein
MPSKVSWVCHLQYIDQGFLLLPGAGAPLMLAPAPLAGSNVCLALNDHRSDLAP